MQFFMKKNAILELICLLSSSVADSIFEILPEELQSKLTIEEKPGGATYLKIYCNNAAQARAFEKILQKAFSIQKIQLKELPFHQWGQRWKKGLKAIRISKRLVICPSWIKYRKKNHEKIIRVDPGMAFGTGHHATTRMCLEWLESRAKSWKTICDVGCGSGILAISAVKLGTKKAVGIDIDTEAVGAAKENARLNRVAGKISWFTKDISKKKVSWKFDCVLANLTARDIEKNWNALIKRVKTQGILILAGIEASQIHWFENWLQKRKNLCLEDQKIQNGWHGYLLRKI